MALGLGMSAARALWKGKPAVLAARSSFEKPSSSSSSSSQRPLSGCMSAEPVAPEDAPKLGAATMQTTLTYQSDGAPALDSDVDVESGPVRASSRMSSFARSVTSYDVQVPASFLSDQQIEAYKKMYHSDANADSDGDSNADAESGGEEGMAKDVDMPMIAQRRAFISFDVPDASSFLSAEQIRSYSGLCCASSSGSSNEEDSDSNAHPASEDEGSGAIAINCQMTAQPRSKTSFDLPAPSVFLQPRQMEAYKKIFVDDRHSNDESGSDSFKNLSTESEDRRVEDAANQRHVGMPVRTRTLTNSELPGALSFFSPQQVGVYRRMLLEDDNLMSSEAESDSVEEEPADNAEERDALQTRHVVSDAPPAPASLSDIQEEATHPARMQSNPLILRRNFPSPTDYLTGKELVQVLSSF